MHRHTWQRGNYAEFVIQYVYQICVLQKNPHDKVWGEGRTGKAVILEEVSEAAHSFYCKQLMGCLYKKCGKAPRLDAETEIPLCHHFPL